MNTVPARLNPDNSLILCGNRNAARFPCTGIIAKVTFTLRYSAATGWRLVPKALIRFLSSRRQNDDGVFEMTLSVRNRYAIHHIETDRPVNKKAVRDSRDNELAEFEYGHRNTVRSFPALCECPECDSSVLVSGDLMESVPVPREFRISAIEDARPPGESVSFEIDSDEWDDMRARLAFAVDEAV